MTRGENDAPAAAVYRGDDLGNAIFERIADRDAECGWRRRAADRRTHGLSRGRLRRALVLAAACRSRRYHPRQPPGPHLRELQLRESRRVGDCISRPVDMHMNLASFEWQRASRSATAETFRRRDA